jgi:exodeoxyribonuclease V gamma subunit
LYWSIATLWREQNPELQEADYLQQVTRLFQLFQRYLIERPDWLLHWDQHRPSAPQMVWQAKLWQQIRPLLPDAPYASMIHAIKEPASERLATVGRVIVFNPDRLSSLALEALEAWTHNTPCFLCLQSPSPSPWFTQGIA